MTVKIDLHAGHFIGGGAKSYLDETAENRAILAEMEILLSSYDCIVYDSTNNDRPREANLDNIVSAVNKHNADISISLHLDSYNGTASGCTGYNWDERTKELSDLITSKIAKALGIRNRGYKEANFQVLRETNPLAILIEFCYVDSKVDYEKWNAKKAGRAVVEALVEYYNIPKIKSSGSNTTPTKPDNNCYPIFNNTSIVDGLKSIGVNSDMEYRKKIAEANGIVNYIGRASQNEKLLSLAKQGNLKKPSSETSNEYYPAFSSTSIVDGLKSIGVDSSLNYRKKIAKANGIWSYSGRAGENIKLLELAKAGKLKRV